MKIALGTRFYEQNPEKLKDIPGFINNIVDSVDLVYFVINEEADKTNASKFIRDLNLPKTTCFSMNVWGKFTPALNAIVYNTAMAECTHLLLCSVEMNITPEIVDSLKEHMDGETLVVGAKLLGHEFNKGTVVGTGTTIPWNTVALWNLRYLSRTGFLLVGDAPFDPGSAGVEELTTCAVLQKLYPHLKIKLVEIPGLTYKIQNLSTERMALHAKKLSSKEDRAQKQLDYIELDNPKVIHL